MTGATPPTLVRRLLLTLAVVGTLVFGTLFAMTWTHPRVLEAGLREVLRIEVERRVGEKIDALSDSVVAGFARRALARVDGEIAAREAALRRDVPAQVAKVVADMTDADCECRRRLRGLLREGERAELRRLAQSREQLVGLIETTYARVARGLLGDARVVFGSNAVAFALVGVLALVRRRAGLQLLAPTVAIVLAVAVTFWSYLFKQDWLHTLVYSDFTGLAYAGWLVVVAAFFVDIAANRARVSTHVVNAVCAVLGVAATAVAC